MPKANICASTEDSCTLLWSITPRSRWLSMLWCAQFWLIVAPLSKVACCAACRAMMLL